MGLLLFLALVAVSFESGLVGEEVPDLDEDEETTVDLGVRERDEENGADCQSEEDADDPHDLYRRRVPPLDVGQIYIDEGLLMASKTTVSVMKSHIDRRKEKKAK